ncbi:MAG: 2-C-methyl-D-erythritol 2,4-cyclodiphosphate synthase [bacterium]|nr:2-C-methyl-D-erythritol 2,4-cyclodiphosphate synthase [bacterium]MDT8365324.1 2-C-methyl-D-erythritol 2,4-cyclodiphosphate synthase [bacterium]
MIDQLRVGIGYDSHRLVEGRKLILGGVDIPAERGLLGYSDADVLLHALMDALLGAAALGDIGQHFPNTDEAYKDADSLELLKEVLIILGSDGYEPVNADITVIAEQPKIAPHIGQMIVNIEAAGMPEGSVNIKATTGEGMGFVGRGEGMAAHAVAMIKRV